MSTIKQVQLTGGTYDLSAKYILDGANERDFQYIKDLIDAAAGAGLKVVVDEESSTNPGYPATTASATTAGKIYIVQLAGTTAGTYTEFLTVVGGTEAAPTYTWERIGTTEVDLSDYVKKGVEFADAAKSAGVHTHTVTGAVTVPSITTTPKNLSATLGSVVLDVSTSTTDPITGIGTAKEGALGTGTEFNVTGGAYTGATQASFTQGTDSFTQGSQAAWSGTVENGVLSFSFTPNTLPTFTQGSDSFTANEIGSVSAITVVPDYSSSVVQAVTDVSIASRQQVVTMVSVSQQPTITLNGDAATGVAYVPSVSVGTAVAKLMNGEAASAGAHTHDVEFED